MAEKAVAEAPESPKGSLKIGYLQEIHKQREWVKRLEGDVEDKELALKQAKKRAETAHEDLLTLCDPHEIKQGELFAGELLIDPTTGYTRGYRSIADIEQELQEQKDREARAAEDKRKKAEAKAAPSPASDGK